MYCPLGRNKSTPAVRLLTYLQILHSGWLFQNPYVGEQLIVKSLNKYEIMNGSTAT